MDTGKAPGKQERAIWTACKAPGRHQGGRKGLIGQPARRQGGTREAGKDQLDSLRGTREAGKDHFGQPEGHQGGTREAGKTNWTAWEAPRRHQGGRKGLIGQPGGTREVPGRQDKTILDSLRGSREA